MVVLAVSWAAYRVVERALTIAAMERTANASQRLATMLEESARRQRNDLRRLASDARTLAFIVRHDAGDRVAVQGVLDSVRKANSSMIGIAIRSRDDAVHALLAQPKQAAG